ncbi:MAG: ABC transporter ATP-binding protein, partial [Clostridia bacterium]|nr:ABC transporter ATP-binding protein [Clostridia bacterium]
MILVDDVEKRYGRVNALEQISFQLHPGQIVGLLGQNGAGKTTLLNILTGNLAPTTGRVLIDGQNVMTDGVTARRSLGYLPEHVPLYPEMTVREQLTFFCRIKGVAKESIAPHILDIAALSGIQDVLDRRCGNLSKGYRQRVGLAQALCGDPKALVLDEPTVGLDPVQIADFRDTLKKLKSNRLILLSSHILGDVQSVCDRILILHRGVLRKDLSLDREAQERVTLRAEIALGKDQTLAAVRRLPSVLQAEA